MNIFSKHFVSRTIYGSIITLAVLFILDRNPPEPWSAVGMLLGTALAVALAETFSQTIAEMIAGSKRLDAQGLLTIWRQTRPILISANLPTVVMILAAGGVFSIGMAITIAKVLQYLVLFLSGLQIGRILHESRPRILASAMFTAGIGGLISLFKVLFH